MKHIYIRISNLFIFLLISVALGYGQSSTMYYMGTVPQSYHLNPATQPKCSFYLGMPAVSPLYVDFANSGISPTDIVFKDPQSDSVIHLLHPNANLSDFISNMKDVEYLSLKGSFNLISFGFKVKDMFFSFDATIKTSEKINYPKSVFNFLLTGNSDESVFDLNALNINSTIYAEYGINISKNYSDYISFGIRPKLLVGLAHISNQNNILNINTGVENWSLDIDSDLRIAAPFEIPTDEDGNIDPEGEFVINDSTLNLTKLQSNKGLGIDLGIHLRPMEELELSASVLDLGYINWKNNTHVTNVSGSFVYEGIEFRGDSLITGDLLDSLRKSINTSGSKGSFVTGLNPKILIGGRYFLTESLDVGLLSKTIFTPDKTIQDISILANLHPTNGLALSASYSLTNRGYSSIGIGVGFKVLWILNMYILVDYIPLLYDYIPVDGLEEAPIKNIPLPVNYYNTNIRIGFNLMFGGRKIKRLSQDKPLFNSSEWMY